MQTPEKVTLPTILLPFAPMHKVAMGVAAGVVTGLIVWLATVVLILKGGPVVGPTLGLLSQYMFGYDVTWSGAFVGLAWGFVIGFLVGWTFAAVRNLVFRGWLAYIRSRSAIEQYGNLFDRM